MTGTLEIVSLQLIEQYPSIGTIGVEFIQDRENQLRTVMLLAQPGLCLSSCGHFCFRLPWSARKFLQRELPRIKDRIQLFILLNNRVNQNDKNEITSRMSMCIDSYLDELR